MISLSKLNRYKHYYLPSILILALLIIITSTCSSRASLVDRLNTERAKAQKLTYENALWKRAYVGISNTLTPDIESPTDDVEPIIEANLQTVEVPITLPPEIIEVPIPCPQVDEIDTAQPEVTCDIASNVPTYKPPMMSGNIQLKLDMLADNSIYWDAKVNTQLRYPSLNNRIYKYNLPLDKEKSNIEIAPSLDKAIKYYSNRPSRFSLTPRNVRHWRTGWAIGPVISYDPFNSNVDMGVGVMYGIQF